ncbi:MAG: hypothetical protein J6J51_07005 [Clostridia bacterium]|nr:hypothetical protein [Clostridia bacterium]
MKKQKNHDVSVWDSQWQKRRLVWTKKHTAFAVFAAVGVLFIAFIGWRYFTFGPESEADLRADFNTYVFDLMEEYKPRYVLYDQLSDPQTLLQQEEHWSTTAAADAQSAVQILLGEGCVIQNWEELKQAEADRLWQEWYYAEKASRMDVFVITELSLHIDHQNLPALQENSWLVQNAQGDNYLLIHSDGIWGVKLMAWFQ